jgi:hypothetical protein
LLNKKQRNITARLAFKKSLDLVNEAPVIIPKDTVWAQTEQVSLKEKILLRIYGMYMEILRRENDAAKSERKSGNLN